MRKNHGLLFPWLPALTILVSMGLSGCSSVSGPDPRLEERARTQVDYELKNVESDIVTSDGVRLHYWLYERGTPAVTIFLHGGPGMDSSMFRQMGAAERYADAFGSLLVFDQRGCGLSEAEPSLANTLTFARSIRDIEELRAHVIPNSDVIIYGRSFGGLLAVHYAASMPKHVLGYILDVPGIFFGPTNDQGRETLHELHTDKESSEILGQSALSVAIRQERDKVSKTFPQELEGTEVSSDTELSAEPWNPGATFVTNENLFNEDYYPLLSSLKDIPTLVISGEYDTVVSAAAIDAMKPYLKQATFLEFPKAWHFATYVHEAETHAAIENLFERMAQGEGI